MIYRKLTLILFFIIIGLSSASLASRVYPVAGNRKFRLNVFLFLFLVFIGGFSFTSSAYGVTQVYYSVGQNTDSHETGAGNVTVSGTAVTFTVDQTATNMGVGDVIDYDTDNKLCYISGKTSGTVWSCTNATGGTPTSATGVVVNSISHAFNSLSVAEAGAPTLLGNSDLTAIDVQLNFPCYYDTGADTTAVTIDGYTTDATRYIKVYTPNNIATEVNQSQRHSGKWDDGKYNLNPNIATRPIIIQIDNIKVDGLQISSSYSGSWSQIFYIAVDGTGYELSNSILKGNNLATDGIYTSNGISSMAVKIWNNIIYDVTGRAINENYTGATSTWLVYANTIYGCAVGLQRTESAITSKNNIAQNCADGYNGTFDAASDYNISDLAADAPGANSKNSTTVSFVDAPNKDFHLSQSDTVARNAGADLSADANLSFATDIDGASRNVSINTWDIGADETATQIYRSVGPGATAVLESDTAHARTVTLTSGVATFSVALADNVGVGDALIIDTGGTADAIDASDTLLFIHGRTDSTHYTLRTHTGAIPADIAVNDTYQIYRAYTSLSLAEAGTKNTSIPITFNGGDRDLVANNEEWNIACYANGVTADTAYVAVNGWTTGAQNYIKIYTPVNLIEVGISQRHNGKWDTGKYYIEQSADWSMVLNIFSNYVRVVGLQLDARNSNTYGVVLETGSGKTNSYRLIDSNIIRNSATSPANRGIEFRTYQTSVVSNNLVYNFGNTGIKVASYEAYSSYFAYNNTVINSNYGISGAPNIANSEYYIKNNISQNNAVVDFDSLTSTFTTNNISSDATSPNSGATDCGGHSCRNQIVLFIDFANKDFHLAQTDTMARGAGANLTAEIAASEYLLAMTRDVDGQLRNPVGAGWDIGADEGTVEFTPTVMQSGGDYSTLSSWEAGVQTDLVATTTRVFAHGGITGTIADNASVTGLTSNATATVVHASANQILLENISGTFASGETVQVTAGNSVVISDNGNPASAVAKIDGAWTAADTTAVDIDGWNSGADNYIKVYTTPTARHLGKYDTTKYRLEMTINNALTVEEANVAVDGLQIYLKGTNQWRNGVYIPAASVETRSNFKLSNNIIRDEGIIDNRYGLNIANELSNNWKIYNNIIYNFSVANSYSYWINSQVGGAQLYSNTFYNNGKNNFNWQSGIVKNNISQGCGGSCFNGTADSYIAGTSNNISSDGTAPGSSGSKINAQVKFISTVAGSEDFHLAPDDKFAKDAGVETRLIASLQYDIDGQIRTGAYDIGADETATQIYRSVGPGKTDTLDNDTGHTKNVTLSGGIATFNVALPDNIGVGDAVIIDTAGTADTIDSADTLLFISRRNSPTSYNLQTNNGSVPGDIPINDTYQIYRAHTSLSNAEAGTINSTLSTMGFAAFNGGNRDLVANNEQWNIACYANGTTADATAVWINGWITNAQNFIKAYTPVNANEVGTSQRHSGKWDDGKYRVSAAGYGVISASQNDVVIDGIQIELTGSTNDHRGFSTFNSDNITLKNCILKTGLRGLRPGINGDPNPEGDQYYYNNIIYGFNRGVAVGQYNGRYYIYNNTIYDCDYGYSSSAGNDNKEVTVKNNIAQNCTDGYYAQVQTFSSSSDYNISDLVADAPGANSKNLTTVNFIDATNKNFCLSSDDTAAKGAGVNLSTDVNLSFTDDIRGQSRPASPNPWSIGTCEALDAKKIKLEGTQIKMEGDVKFE